MKFVYPEFLIALTAIAIPIVIHLFNFRRFKKVYFSNVRFLKEVQIETQSRSRIKYWLVLLSRILAISCLVLAFAQPFLPATEGTVGVGTKAVSIFVDNSFSMSAINDNGILLDEAKRSATQILEAYQPADKFQLMTNDFEARQQRLMNKEEFIEALEDVKITPTSRKLSEVFSRQVEALREFEGIKRNYYQISDYQKSIADVTALETDSFGNVFFVPIQANIQSNLFIDTCWFKSPIRQLNQVDELYVKIKNNSDETYDNIPIKLNVNGEQKSLASFSIAPGEAKDVKMVFTNTNSGIHFAQLSITDYPITYDDVFYFSYSVADEIPVLGINGTEASRAVGSLFNKDQYFIYSEFPENGINYSTFKDHSFIILNALEHISSGLVQEILSFVEAGGSVLIIPSHKGYLDEYNELLLTFKANTISTLDSTKTKVTKLSYESDIFRNVFQETSDNIDLPVVSKHIVFSRTSRTAEEPIMTLANGESYLSSYNYEQGKVYVLAGNLDTKSSNFARHALFVPVLYNMALHSQSSNDLFYTIGKDELVDMPNQSISSDEVFKIKSIKSDLEIIPSHRSSGVKTQIMLQNQISEAGNYLLNVANDTLSGLAFNYDRKESNLECFDENTLKAEVEKLGMRNYRIIQGSAKGLGSDLLGLSQGTKFWKLFILLTLIFIGFEVLLLKFWKN